MALHAQLHSVLFLLPVSPYTLHQFDSLRLSSSLTSISSQPPSPRAPPLFVFPLQMQSCSQTFLFSSCRVFCLFDREVAKIVLCSIISLWILLIFASPLSRWKTAFESELCYLIVFLPSKLRSLAKIQPAWVSFLDMMSPTEKHVANTPRSKSDNATSGQIYVDGSDCITLDNWQRALVSFNLITTSCSLTLHLML